MKRGDLVRLPPTAAGRLGRRTGVVLKVSPSMNGDVATVLLDPTQAYPAVNHFVPAVADELKVIGRAVRLTLEQISDLEDALRYAVDDCRTIAKEEIDDDVANDVEALGKRLNLLDLRGDG